MAKSLFLCLLLLTSPGLARARAAEATPALIAETQAALEKGDAAEAQRLADAGLKGHASGAERAQLLLSRGLARELLGSHEQALEDFTAAINGRALAVADRAQALLQRGFLNDGLGRLDAAARDYGAVVALKTGLTATALNTRANVFRRQNRLDEARRDYLAALQAGSAKPQYPYYGLGQIAEAQHDKEAARGFYAKAVAVDPSYGLASERLAELGGPAELALTEPDVVRLHQPAPRTDIAPPSQKARPAPGRIVLKRPRQHAGRPAPAPSLGLRPALDAPVSVATGAEVQLGAWRSEAEAQAGWIKAQGKAGSLLDGLTPHIVAADLPGKGRYYRLRTAPAAGQSRSRLCAAMVRQGLACLVTAN